MFWAIMQDIEVISSLPGSPYFFFKKNGPVKHCNVYKGKGLVLCARRKERGNFTQVSREMLDILNVFH